MPKPDNSTPDVNFFDFDITRRQLLGCSVGCLVYYTETLLGESDHMLLSIIETLVEGVQIPVLTEGAPYVYMYTMSVTFLNHLRSRIALSSTKLPAVVSSQMSAKLKGQDRRRLDDTSKQGIRSSAGVPDKTRGEGAERVLEDQIGRAHV